MCVHGGISTTRRAGISFHFLTSYMLLDEKWGYVNFASASSRTKLAFVLVLLVCLNAMGADNALRQGLVVLEETGRTRDNIPVFRRHTEEARIAAILSRGFAGRLVRLFGYEQRYLWKKGGPMPEPAYLLLSSRKGGFPRFGFYLDAEDKHSAGYVDLPREQALTGEFGAVDQVFPHELAHVILRQLAGQRSSWANQVHAIGVRTDPGVALDEGFAEHCQVMAIEDHDADLATSGLAHKPESIRLAYGRLRSYQRELSTGTALAGRWRMTFPLWFSGVEQVLRYDAVKANAFAFEPALPDHLLKAGDPYTAYLLENILPGSIGDPPKTVARMLSTEGVMSGLFYRWVNSVPLGKHYLDQTFYDQFGVTRVEIAPVENVYLKLFQVFYAYKPQNTIQVVMGYRAAFPEEEADLNAIVKSVLLGQPLPDNPAIWLANPYFKTGTTVFDQFRGAPRLHTFDLNAASLVDLLGVPGMNKHLAESILEKGPYVKLEDLRQVPGFTPALLTKFQFMAAQMSGLRVDRDAMENEVPIASILLPYIWRALTCSLLAGLLGSAFYRVLVPCEWLRATITGLVVAVCVLSVGWLMGGHGLWIMFALVFIFEMLVILWRIRLQCDWRPALRALIAWVAAAMPAAAILQPWF